MSIKYLDFDILFERSPDGHRVRVLEAPAGEASSSDFVVPFGDQELENFVLRLGRFRGGIRRIDPPQTALIKGFGGRLFDALFHDELLVCLRSSTQIAHSSGPEMGLRLRLRLGECPELGQLPWEFMYDAAINRFLCLDTGTALVRYLDLPLPVPSLSVKAPLRILVMIASPNDFPPLDVEQEWSKVNAAVATVVRQGLVTVERLPAASLGALRDRLRQGPCHVFHFIGHGSFDAQREDGMLVTTDEAGRGRLIAGEDLGVMLHNHPSLRLVVLNACEGARGDVSDPFAGVAQGLVQQGVPVVVAMQFEITDKAAIVFSRAFYESLAASSPVDAAIGEGRLAVYAEVNPVEWGTPVLYMRTPEGTIFDVAPSRTSPGWWTRLTMRLRLRRGFALGAAGIVLVGAVAIWLGVFDHNGRRQSWQHLPDLPVALEGAGAAVFDGQVWIAGGVAADNTRQLLDNVEVYDPAMRRWSDGPRLPIPVAFGILVAVKQRLYMIGGQASDGATAAVYRLDSPTGEWVAAGELPDAREAGAAVYDGSRIVYAGGLRRDHQVAGDVFVRPDGSEVWQRAGLLPQPREKLAAASDGFGTAWFIGGRDDLANLPATGEVDQLRGTTMSVVGRVIPIHSAPAVWWPGRGVCVIGGATPTGFSSTVQCLDRPEITRDNSLPSPRAGVAAAVEGPDIYIAGGYDNGQHGSASFEVFHTG